VIGFVAKVGDMHFTDPRQIQKLTGLEITKISSDKKKGQLERQKKSTKDNVRISQSIGKLESFLEVIL